jgi:hypothetical protein
MEHQSTKQQPVKVSPNCHREKGKYPISEVNKVSRILINLTPKDYVMDLTFPQDIV